MKPVEQPPVSLGGGHCCACTSERGSVCGHIEGPFLCDRHLEPVRANPMVTPDNPLGKWELPYEPVDDLVFRSLDGLVVDSCDVAAAVSETPLGRMPVLVFAFKSSSIHDPDRQPPRFMFIGDASTLLGLAGLVTKAAKGAVDAAFPKEAG